MDDDRMSVSSGSSDLYEPADTVVASAAHAPPAAINPPLLASASPKHSIEDGDGGHTTPDKRRRLDGEAVEIRIATPGPRSAADDLPAEVWQHVLSYLNPPELGRVMCVSRSLLHCLDGSVPTKQRSASKGGTLQTIDAEAIWSTWRIAHLEESGNMPKPLDGHTERDMWRLIRGVRCDVCDKPDTEPRKPISPDRWHGGPTMSTTRAVWSFALRMCGECLYRHCEKDTALLCNPTTQRFRPALPYAMVTHGFHYIPTTVLKEAGQAPSGLHVAKQYFKPHIESIVADWERTLTLGQGAAEEWLKGLSSMGKQTSLDSARWEHWEAKGGLNRVLFAFTQLQPAPLLHPTPTPGWVQSNMLGWPIQSLPPQHQQFGMPPSIPATTFAHHNAMPALNNAAVQLQNQFSPQASMPAPFAQPNQVLPQPGTIASIPQRQDRTPRDAEGAKAARRQQIEQRCLTELDPPIPPNVLRHMPSFRAAILIGIPLNDHGWEMLKPKLLEQYEQALVMERETTRQLLAVQQQVQAETKRQAAHINKDPRDTQEKEWEEKLRPQRERLGAIADEYVRQHWRGGQSVNSGNVARFAMSVFDHVRKTFYSELQSTDHMALLMGQPIPQDAPDGPFLRRLTLETMKWVYDHKIRPLTRDYGKEIFFCNGAGCEFTNKHFAFEGVIQHYGAKHTNDYSRGNVIVHWQTAEWPEDLPFYDPGSGPTRPYHINGGFSRGTTISPQVTSGAPYNVPSLTTSPFGATPRSNNGNGPFTPPVGNGFLSNIPTMQPGIGQYPIVNLANQPAPMVGHDPTDLSQFFLAANAGKPDPSTSKAAMDKDAADKLTRIMEELTAKSVQPITSGLATVPSEEKKSSIMDVDVPDFAAFQDQQNYVADTARFAWTRTNAIDGMLSSVRVFAVLQYTLLQFSQRFQTKLSIDTFATALMNVSGMEPLKHANNLFCNQCQADGSAVSVPLTSATDLWSLMEHFQKIHVRNNALGADEPTSRSWVKEMIALPPPETIPELINAAGMRDDKLAILADAFPGQLPRKMPHGKSTNDSSDGKQNKKHKRVDRKVSNGRRQDFDDANYGDTEGSGQHGFRSTHSLPDPNGAPRRSPKHYGEDDEEEYDPSKPMLPERSRKRREFGRKTSGMGMGPSLEEMLRIETEKSNRAAAEENRRRGIVSEARAEAPSIDEVAPEASYHHPRITLPNSRPGSAPRPTHVYPNDTAMGDHPSPYSGYPPADRLHFPHTDNYRPERTDSRPTRVSREGHDDGHATGTPPSGRKSRYSRYDEQHERILRDRTRSRSPIRYEDVMYERPQLRQREYLAPEQPPGPYRHAEEPGGVIYDQYGRRLIPVRDDGPQPPVYPVQRRSPGTIEYLDHRHHPTYDQQYYVHTQDPRYAPHAPYDTRPAQLAQHPLPVRDIRYAE